MSKSVITFISLPLILLGILWGFISTNFLAGVYFTKDRLNNFFDDSEQSAIDLMTEYVLGQKTMDDLIDFLKDNNPGMLDRT